MRYTGFRDRPFQPLRHPSDSFRQAGKPDLRGIQFTKFPPFLEEFREDFAARTREDTRGDRDPVIEPRVGDDLI